MTTDEVDQQLCPFTLKPIPTSDPLNVAVLWNTFLPKPGETTTTIKTTIECGHKCSLVPLIGYLQGDEGAGTKVRNQDNSSSSSNTSNRISQGTNRSMCPVCGISPIVTVLDEIATSLTTKKIGLMNLDLDLDCDDVREDETNYDVVAFRYGKQIYRLAVLLTKKDGGMERNVAVNCLTAQDRIASCLGMEVEIGMKVLHKGKVIHPDPTSYPEQISLVLLRISNDDFINKRKPSLIVMGTRIGRELRNPYADEIDHRRNIASVGVTVGGIPRKLLGVLHWTFWTFIHTTRSVLGAMFLFVRSLLLLPRAALDRRDDRDD